MRELSCLVKDMVDGSRMSDVQKLRTGLGPDDYKRVISEYPPRHYGGSDKVIWRLQRNGSFSVKSAYSSCCDFGNTNPIFKLIWRLEVPERVKFFLWKIAHNRLLTKDLWSRWFGGQNECPVCPGIVETSSHALRDCPKASETFIMSILMIGFILISLIVLL